MARTTTEEPFLKIGLGWAFGHATGDDFSAYHFTDIWVPRVSDPPEGTFGVPVVMPEMQTLH
jgi:hypothetical protein